MIINIKLAVDDYNRQQEAASKMAKVKKDTINSVFEASKKTEKKIIEEYFENIKAYAKAYQAGSITSDEMIQRHRFVGSIASEKLDKLINWEVSALDRIDKEFKGL